MSFFISDAIASSTTSTDASLTPIVIVLLLFSFIFYLTIIKPQQKRNKEHRELMNSIARGDEVLTNGGLIGRVTKVNENGYVVIALNNTTEVIIKRNFITAILPKGTMKAM